MKLMVGTLPTVYLVFLLVLINKSDIDFSRVP
jgi:hypothetical protein